MAKLMIKTPCSTFTLSSIMCCVFGIKTFDVSVYFILLNNGALKVNDISEKLNRDRSTVQRAVQSLVNAGLAKRKQINLKEGGYFYVYGAIPFEEVKNAIKNAMESWCDEVKYWVNSIEDKDLKNMVDEDI